MPWPLKSLDLNTSEQLWEVLSDVLDSTLSNPGQGANPSQHTFILYGQFRDGSLPIMHDFGLGQKIEYIEETSKAWDEPVNSAQVNKHKQEF